MTCHEKDENVGLQPPKFLIPANTKSVTTVDMCGSQSEYSVALSVIVETSSFFLYNTLNWS